MFLKCIPPKKSQKIKFFFEEFLLQFLSLICEYGSRFLYARFKKTEYFCLSKPKLSRIIQVKCYAIKLIFLAITGFPDTKTATYCTASSLVLRKTRIPPQWLVKISNTLKIKLSYVCRTEFVRISRLDSIPRHPEKATASHSETTSVGSMFLCCIYYPSTKNKQFYNFIENTSKWKN